MRKQTRMLRFSLRNLKLHSKVLLLVLLMVVVNTITFSLLYDSSVEAYTNRLYEDKGESLLTSIDRIETEMRELQKDVTSTATSSEIQLYIREMETAESGYERFQARNKVIQAVYSSLNQKTYILSYYFLFPSNELTSISNDASFSILHQNDSMLNEIAKAQNGRYLWLGPLEGDSEILLLCPVRDKENLSLDYMGTIILRIQLSRLVSIVSPVTTSGQSLNIFLDGKFICSSGDTIDFDTLEIPHDFSKFTIVKDKSMDYFITRMKSDYSSFEYLYILEDATLFSEFHSLRIFAFTVYSIMSIFLVIIALWISNSITRPLKHLVEQMRQVSSVDFSKPNAIVQKESGGGEIGILSNAYQYMLNRIHTLIEENYIKQIVIKDTQYRSLQSQINPHFMYNTLDSIYWMARGENDDVAQMVYSLGCLLRSATEKPDAYGWKIRLHEELTLLEHYIGIQKMRFCEKLSIKINIDESLQNLLVPRMLLQPLVENSIKYGVEMIDKPCSISVNARIDSRNRLVLNVTDNGIGPPDTLMASLENNTLEASGSGIGLSNIFARIALLYGETGSLQIHARAQGGTEVTISIPCERSGE